MPPNHHVFLWSLPESSSPRPVPAPQCIISLRTAVSICFWIPFLGVLGSVLAAATARSRGCCSCCGGSASASAQRSRLHGVHDDAKPPGAIERSSDGKEAPCSAAGRGAEVTLGKRQRGREVSRNAAAGSLGIRWSRHNIAPGLKAGHSFPERRRRLLFAAPASQRRSERSTAGPER